MNTTEEERFARNAFILADAIHEGVTRLNQLGYSTISPFIVELAKNIISGFDHHYLIQGFIDNSHEMCWDFIKNRNEIFFIENASTIFKYLPMEQVNLFKDLFMTKDINGNCIIDVDTKNEIWELFDAMVKISIKYIHKGRSPYSQNSQSGITSIYGAEFFNHVDIDKHSKIWSVKLEFPINI